MTSQGYCNKRFIVAFLRDLGSLCHSPVTSPQQHHTSTCSIKMIAALSSFALFVCIENANAFVNTHRSLCMSGDLGFGSEPKSGTSVGRRSVVIGGAGGIFGGIFGGNSQNIAFADEGGDGEAPKPAPVVPPPPAPAPTPPPSPRPFKYKNAGPTNEVVKTVEGIKRRRLGGSDILVSEMGLGTQRWLVFFVLKIFLIEVN